MPLSDYLVGAAWFTLSLGGALLAATLIVRRRLAHLVGEDRVLAFFLLAVAALSLVHLLPLAAGVLTRATPAVTAALLCALLSRLPRGAAREPAPPPEPVAPSGRASWTVAAIAATAAAVTAVSYVVAVAFLPFTHVDVVAFHLPVAARWIQSGSMWHIDQFLPYQAQGNYPQGAALMELAAMLPWHNDFAVRYLSLPFVAMTGVGVYAIARELRVPSATAVVFGAVVTTLPGVAVSSFDFELPDSIMYSTFAAGILFLLRHVRTGRAADLALAGVGLGLAFGVKWYAVSSVAVVVVVWAVALLLARRPARRVLTQGAKLVGLILACGGCWLLRNWIESGNPVFPVRVAPFGWTVFDAPFDRYRALAGFSISHYADEPRIWRHVVLPAFNRTFGAAWVVVTAGSVLAAVLAVRRSRACLPVLAMVACAALLAIAYVLTPYTAFGPDGAPVGVAANARYAVPALLIAAAASAWAAAHAGRWRIVVELAGLVAVADGVRRTWGPAEPRHAAAAIGALLALFALTWAWRTWRSRIPRPLPRRAVSVGAAASVLALALLTAAGYAAQRRFNDHRYRTINPALAWVRDHRHHRVGLAGLFPVRDIYPVLPAFGPRFGNTVEFVGPVIREMLNQYSDRAAFAAALRRGHYDELVIGRDYLPGTPQGEESWARSAGFEEAVATPALVLLRPRSPPR